ncbi:olfactory receptor 8U1-like [Spea bombifrons]|uniref:olfactory receptor 8U1-like n=1 Tax=Spea bombifrons TaxID=233779 RepID=UPI00234C0120|nr:olfactory receptor 8U1-like [Spea bombifrons]
MGKQNETVTEFILKTFTEDRRMQHCLFGIFLLIYLLTVLGNAGIIALIQTDPLLNTPMYFFLKNLSFLDICYATVIAPQTLTNLLTNNTVLSFSRCAAQLFWFAGFGITELLLLASMAYDRFVAICRPLLYRVVMTPRLCYWLLAISYIGSFGLSVILCCFILNLFYCGPNRVNHFFCDGPPLIKLACGDKKLVQLLLFILVGSTDVLTLLTILISYLFIISSILTIQSAKGKWKTFSTCSSHLTSVFILYGTVIYMYLQPPSDSPETQDWFVSVFYTMIIPMLNPLIYSVRNNQVKEAFKKIHARYIEQSIRNKRWL